MQGIEEKKVEPKIEQPKLYEDIIFDKLKGTKFVAPVIQH